MHCWILLTDVRAALNSFGSFGQPCGMDDLDRFECRLDLSRGWWCIFRLAFYPRLFSSPRFHISKSSLNWSERNEKCKKCTIATLKSLHLKQSSLERVSLGRIRCTVHNVYIGEYIYLVTEQTETYRKSCILIYLLYLTYICPSSFDCEVNTYFWIFVKSNSKSQRFSLFLMPNNFATRQKKA